MTLAEYRKQMDLTQAEIARRLGVDEASMSRWCNGAAIPPPTMIYEIQKLTGGLVTLADWVQS